MEKQRLVEAFFCFVCLRKHDTCGREDPFLLHSRIELYSTVKIKLASRRLNYGKTACY